MKNQKGFTIVEIITVLVIITLIATMAIAGISGAKGRIDSKAYNSKVKLIEQAAALYAKENSEKIKEEFGSCTKTSGNCDCTGDSCVYRFNTTVQELIELGYYESEVHNKCLVENPKDRDKCFDKEPIEIIIDADEEGVEAHFGEEFDPYDITSSTNKMCELTINGDEGTNGWYIGDNNKLILTFKIDEENVAKYGISKNIDKTYNNISEVPLSSTVGATYYGFVKDKDGNEGSCVVKNIKVDSTNPTDPNMEIDNNFNVVFNGSKDTYSERVKYSYVIDEDNSVIGTKYKIPNNTNFTEKNIQVSAFDYAGNFSNIISKKLMEREPISGTITSIRTHYCNEGYTCSDSPCTSTSVCVKIDEKIPVETKKYKCDINGEIYDSLDIATTNCMSHESGTVTITSVYSCPTDYTCSTTPCTSSSRCLKTITEPVQSTLKYKCDLNNEIYDTYQDAVANCKESVSGTVTTTSNYTCPTGYICSDSPCKSTSRCTKLGNTSMPISNKFYVCYVKGEYIGSYITLSEAQRKCKKIEPGVITTHSQYQCNSGYTCSDGENCNATSTCYKTASSEVAIPKFTCYLNGSKWGEYSTYEEAATNCTSINNGEVTIINTYYCPSGYTCSDGENCNATSTCMKNTTSSLIVTKTYKCLLNNIIYETQQEALNNCKKTENGTVSTSAVYSCPSGYTCSTTPCKSTSKCNKTVSANLNSTTKYTCSIHSETLYNSESEANKACVDTQTTKKNYSYISYCSQTSSYDYYWGPTSSNSGYTSCTENTFSCNSSNYGSVYRTCDSYYKYRWDGICKKTSSNTDLSVNSGTGYPFSSKSACQSSLDSYTCPQGYIKLDVFVCSSKKFYSKTEKTCSRRAISKLGPYYCNTSVQSSCEASCASGYTKTVTREACKWEEVSGQTCSSDKTCTGSTTTTCVKTGTVGSKTVYSCPTGYTCSNNCSSSSSTCTKTETVNPTSTIKYNCSYNQVLYDTEEEATAACKKTTNGTIIENDNYSCPTGYTCSNNCSSSSSTCTMTETFSPNINNKYKCSFDDVVYYTEESAIANCKKQIIGSVIDETTYGCPSGYSTNDVPVTENSICKSQNGTNSALYATYTYTCSYNTNTYSSLDSVEAACVKTISGELNEETIYGCPSGYTCSDGENCSQSSICIKYYETQVINQSKYYCSLTGTYYNSLTEAQNNCTQVINGKVSNQYVYTCNRGFTCNGKDNCTSSSVCIRTESTNVSASTRYYCSLTDQYYNSELEARIACTRNSPGAIQNYYVYTCDSPYICSDVACSINSMCINEMTEPTVYDTIYYCSVDPTVVYISNTDASNACQKHCNGGKYNLTNDKCYILE